MTLGTYKGWGMAWIWERLLTLSFLQFEFGKHVNVLHVQNIKSSQKSWGRKSKTESTRKQMNSVVFVMNINILKGKKQRWSNETVYILCLQGSRQEGEITNKFCTILSRFVFLRGRVVCFYNHVGKAILKLFYVIGLNKSG